MFYVYFRHSGRKLLLATARTADTAAQLMVALAANMGQDWNDFVITDEEV
jgi:hypothetical protein